MFEYAGVDFSPVACYVGRVMDKNDEILDRPVGFVLGMMLIWLLAEHLGWL